MENVTMLSIEVVYAASERQQRCIALSVVAGSSIADAITQSAILKHFPEIDLQQNKVGIFGKLKALSEKVSEGDRIEIYRPLRLDPKLSRLKRAKQQKSRGNYSLCSEERPSRIKCGTSFWPALREK